jgi:PAS domain S-box-containing protein
VIDSEGGRSSGVPALDEQMTIAPYDERHFARIVALAADAIICVDRAQRITLFNNGAEKTFGYASAEIIGQRLETLIPERFRAGHEAQVRSFSAGPSAARTMAERRAIYAVRKSGEEFPAEATISKAVANGDEVMTVILRDITAQMSIRDQLERMVAERTNALEAEIRRREDAQAQLVRAQRLEAFGQLTGGIAHDFNNLLTVIGGNLELLRDRVTEERHIKPLGRALDGVAMGARLTQRLLSFARRNRLEPEDLDLNAEIIGVIDLLQRSLGGSITISSVLAPELWTAKADASQVENAILNLAINARDAMPNGGRLIIETSNVTVGADFSRSTTGDELAPGDYARISMSDTGSGMTADVLARAFEPFFTTKAPGKGTGLGLASLYGFARQSGGEVTIYSEPGRGTTVNLYLPRSSGGETPSATAPPTAERLAGHGGRILLVEDNAEVRTVTAERLEDLDYDVTACADASEAMALLGGSALFDLVFSDVVMPGGRSGIDLARWVMANRPGLPVLLTSGFTEEMLRQGDPDAAKLPLLRKPYGRNELARAIATLLPAKRQ